MIYRTNPKNNDQLSQLGFGCSLRRLNKNVAAIRQTGTPWQQIFKVVGGGVQQRLQQELDVMERMQAINNFCRIYMCCRRWRLSRPYSL